MKCDTAFDLMTDPHVIARDIVTTVDDEDFGRMKMQNVMFRMSATPGGIDWTGHEQSRGWYSVFKSRPSFRPLLTERMEVIMPPKHYDQPDF